MAAWVGALQEAVAEAQWVLLLATRQETGKRKVRGKPRVKYVDELGKSGRKHKEDATRILKRDAVKFLGFDPTAISRPTKMGNITYNQDKMRNWLRGKE